MLGTTRIPGMGSRLRLRDCGMQGFGAGFGQLLLARDK